MDGFDLERGKDWLIAAERSLWNVLGDTKRVAAGEVIQLSCIGATNDITGFSNLMYPPTPPSEIGRKDPNTGCDCDCTRRCGLVSAMELSCVHCRMSASSTNPPLLFVKEKEGFVSTTGYGLQTYLKKCD
jgi:hypothetical protein